MMNPYSSKAIQFAKRKYTTIVFLDAAGTEDEGYVTLHPELEGCMSQGDSVQEAIENLADARLLYIESLLQDNLPVPDVQLSHQIHIIVNMAELLGEDVSVSSGEEDIELEIDVQS